MKKLKLIITFILLVSLFLGVVACTPDEESKADVSDVVSAEGNDGEESYPPITEDATSIVGENQITVELYNVTDDLRPISPNVYTTYDDKTLYFIKIGSKISDVIDDEFLKKYGYEYEYNELEFDEDANGDMVTLIEELRLKEIQRLIASGVISEKFIYTKNEYWDVKSETSDLSFFIMVLASEDERQALENSELVSKTIKWDDHLSKTSDGKWAINPQLQIF
ncbi:MAG: hypothetical protein J6L23_03880 [Clostridia bacterium]|nr:hypothetical protein [Clostridia bacterium]